MKNSKGVTILDFLFLFAWAVMLGIVLWKSLTNAQAREPLSLNVSVSVQREIENEWVTINHENVEGLGAVQAHITAADHRVVMTVEKPIDLGGSFRVRTPRRTDGVALVEGRASAQIILGPHEGCQASEIRCEPITLDDVGRWELRLDTEKAVKTSLALFVFRPYDQAPEPVIRPQISYNDAHLPCFSKIKAGWWLFAPHPQAVGPHNAISVCILGPKNYECSNGYETKFWVRNSGIYTIIAWDDRLNMATCVLTAV